MKYKIGVYGPNSVESEETTKLAQHNVIVVTGGCSGIPYVVAHAAKQGKSEIWGFTPECNEQGEKRAYASDDITIYDKLFYIPPAYDQSFFLEQTPEKAHQRSTRLKYRNFLSTPPRAISYLNCPEPAIRQRRRCTLQYPPRAISYLNRTSPPHQSGARVLAVPSTGDLLPQPLLARVPRKA